MAGGIDWFRWHHGSVTDPKFQLVARKAGASLPDVLAVWTYLLEKASAAEFRGCFGDIDAEAVDCLFGFEEGRTDAILTQLVDRKLIADEYVVAWEKRQPKREREDDKSTARVQAFRQKQRQETPGNATERHETPRGEESREEDSVAKATDAAIAPAPLAEAKTKSPADMAKADLWQAAVSVLEAGGCPKAQCRTFMGKLVQDYTLPTVQQAVAAAVTAQPADAREYLKATCQRLKGERKDPVTVPSDEAAKTAAYLAEQASRVHDPPPNLSELLTKAKKAVGTGSLRAVA